MKKLVNTLSVIILLTSACAKNSNQSGTGEAGPTLFGDGNKKLSEEGLLGSYSVEKIVANTSDGDFRVVFPGLVETREILREGSGLIIKQKSVYNGCTREIISDLSVSLETGSYTRQQFKSETCQGSCPQVMSGSFEGHETFAAPDQPLSCNNNSDQAESGNVTIDANDRLIFSYTDLSSGAGLTETNIKN
jgi:hypothetical protein